MSHIADQDKSTDDFQYEKLSIACKKILQKQSFKTQEELRLHLEGMGYEGISQSTVSRLLLNLGVVKIQNSCGQKVYCITAENCSVQITSSIASQIDLITQNKSMVVIKTHPGSAQLIARLIDIDPQKEIIATIGGNDTVLVIPSDIDCIDECLKIVKNRLGINN